LADREQALVGEDRELVRHQRPFSLLEPKSIRHPKATGRLNHRSETPNRRHQSDSRSPGLVR
jgi:hypothetical protein